MTKDEFNSLTQAQRDSMQVLFNRSKAPHEWDEFLKAAIAPTPMAPYVGIPDFHGMFVGIEEDGYTHS